MGHEILGPEDLSVGINAKNEKFTQHAFKEGKQQAYPIFSKTLAATGQAHDLSKFSEIRCRIVQLLLINLPDMHVSYPQLSLH